MAAICSCFLREVSFLSRLVLPKETPSLVRKPPFLKQSHAAVLGAVGILALDFSVHSSRLGRSDDGALRTQRCLQMLPQLGVNWSDLDLSICSFSSLLNWLITWQRCDYSAPEAELWALPQEREPHPVSGTFLSAYLVWLAFCWMRL